MEYGLMTMDIIMEVELGELINILKAEHQVFEKYLGKLTEQQQHLITNDLGALKKSVEEINLLAQEAISLENGRRNIIERLSRELKMDPGDITVSRLLERLKGPNFDELELLRDKITDIHQEVTAQKNRNEQLIGQSMQIIRQTVDYINEANNPKVTYDNPARNGRGASDRGALLSRTM